MPDSLDHHWSTTFDASSEDSDVGESLRRLMQGFWFPVFAFATGRTSSAAETKECVQTFALRFVRDATGSTANAPQSALRAILLAALIAHDWQAEHSAADSNDSVLHLSEQDWAQGRTWFEQLQLETESAESAFARGWAWTLQNRALRRLRKEFSCDGRAEVFAVIDDYLLAADSDIPWAELAESCHMSTTALKTTAARMRERLQTLIQREVAQTVATQADAATEFQLLFEADEQGS